jgi:hypothetical protein
LFISGLSLELLYMAGLRKVIYMSLETVQAWS